MTDKKPSRLRRAAKTRARIRRQEAVRLTVHRTNQHIDAQVVAADGARILASASTAEKEVRAQQPNGGNKAGGRGQARARGAGRSGRRAPGPAGGPRSGGPDAAGLLAVLGSRADVVVLDPPRAGAGPVVIDRLIGLRPRVIAYLACDPASLARGGDHAARRGFRLDTLRVFDLFPMTHHVECMATLRPSDESPGRPGVDLGTAGS